MILRMPLICKLDENLGKRCRVLLEEAGHDVSSVVSQSLEGASDDTLIEVCRIEKRILITLDLDFSNPIRFSPDRYAGIVVLRPPGTTKQQAVIACVSMLIRGLESVNSLSGKLWIVTPKHIREYTPESS